MYYAIRYWVVPSAVDFIEAAMAIKYRTKSKTHTARLEAATALLSEYLANNDNEETRAIRAAMTRWSDEIKHFGEKSALEFVASLALARVLG